jgi:hypothetical protein
VRNYASAASPRSGGGAVAKASRGGKAPVTSEASRGGKAPVIGEASRGGKAPVIRARVFWALGLAWFVASAMLAAQLLRSGAPHRLAAFRASGGVPFSIR